MNAVVLYESLWGNTAAIARGIAEGIGSVGAAIVLLALSRPVRQFYHLT